MKVWYTFLFIHFHACPGVKRWKYDTHFHSYSTCILMYREGSMVHISISTLCRKMEVWYSYIVTFLPLSRCRKMEILYTFPFLPVSWWREVELRLWWDMTNISAGDCYNQATSRTRETFLLSPHSLTPSPPCLHFRLWLLCIAQKRFHGRNT
jgi:hypothetical protein